jgi:AcrR family transcriptional regulator
MSTDAADAQRTPDVMEALTAMAQIEPSEPEAMPTGRRAQNRLLRTREFLGTALKIVTAEGFDALTMQRLADECDSAIGAVYRYFPSKGALMAEVQREAIDRLSTSYLIIRERSGHRFAELELTPEDASMARLVLMGRWFIATRDVYPEEFRLLHMLFSESRNIVSDGEAIRVLSSAIRLLDKAREVVDEAVELGNLDAQGAVIDRVVTWAAAVSAALQLGSLDIYDAELFDGLRLGRALVDDLYRAWGVDPVRLEAAKEIIEQLGEDGPIAPPAPHALL